MRVVLAMDIIQFLVHHCQVSSCFGGIAATKGGFHESSVEERAQTTGSFRSSAVQYFRFRGRNASCSRGIAATKCQEETTRFSNFDAIFRIISTFSGTLVLLRTKRKYFQILLPFVTVRNMSVYLFLNSTITDFKNHNLKENSYQEITVPYVVQFDTVKRGNIEQVINFKVILKILRDVL
jgi:hypothetical protein